MIATDLAGSNRRYEVWVHGTPYATRHSLAEAKASVEELYGPLSWRRVSMPKVTYDHYYFGPTTEMTDPTTLVVVDKLPRMVALSLLGYTGRVATITHQGQEMLDRLALALVIATKAHVGQTDLQGRPYINHPIEVAKAVKSIDAKVVALLHDVLEDSDHTPATLVAEGIPKNLVDSVARMSHRQGQPYPAYIGGIIASGDRIAIEVKLADVRHNLARTRTMPDDHPKKARLLMKYEPAEAALSRA